MEPVGFFTNDIGEPVQALEEQVFAKLLLGGPEGLEISPAGPNPGIGEGLRRMKAMNRPGRRGGPARGGRAGHACRRPRGRPPGQTAVVAAATGRASSWTLSSRGPRAQKTGTFS